MSGKFLQSIEDMLLLQLARMRKRQFYGADAVARQEKVLVGLLSKNRKTVFGRKCDFASIRSSQDYLAKLKSRRYADIKPWIEKIIAGERDILFPGLPVCFGSTTGTAGQAKLIPYTKEVLAAIRKSAIDAAFLGALQHGSMSWHKGKALYIGPRKAEQNGCWHTFSEGTAFIYLQATPLKARFIPEYKDLPRRFEKADAAVLKEYIQKHRVNFVAGNPLEIADFVNETGTVMPEVAIVMNCGFWAADNSHVYKRAFPNATVLDMYGSNEGIWGLPISFGRFLLNYTRAFFSFIPLDNNGKLIGLAHVEPGRKYKLCVTTAGGLWNYETGDVVSFESLQPPIFVLCGRFTRAVQLEDAWLTEDEVVKAVRQAGTDCDNYYIRSGQRNFALVTEQDGLDTDAIDSNLCDVSLAYAQARKSGKLDKLVLQQDRIEKSEFTKPVRIKQF